MNHRIRPHLRLATLAGAAVLSLAFSPAARAADLHVPGDFATIQAAVDAANPGDSVLVDGGVYGPVTVRVADLNLVASNDATIDGGGSIGIRGIEIAATGVTVDGFTVRHADTGIYLGSTGASVVRNFVYENGFGILVAGHDNTIERNKIRRNTEGLVVFVMSAGNLIKANVSVWNRSGGYTSFLSSGNTWEGNTSRNNDTGFLVQSGVTTGNGDVFLNNVAEDNRLDGFDVPAGRGNTFQGNLARRNGYSGFNMGMLSSDNSFDDNRSNRNGMYGYSDASTGAGTAGTANTYGVNSCANNLTGPSDPAGLCP